jgi:hypothetical protein
MRVMNYEECAGAMSITRRSFERLLAAGKGPKVILLSPRRRGVLEEDFESWLRGLHRRTGAPNGPADADAMRPAKPAKTRRAAKASLPARRRASIAAE